MQDRGPFQHVSSAFSRERSEERCSEHPAFGVCAAPAPRACNSHYDGELVAARLTQTNSSCRLVCVSVGWSLRLSLASRSG
jgi:hypothetical protein